MDVATRYIDRGGSAFAYQAFGKGPTDVVIFLEIGMHLDVLWSDPDMHENLERLGRNARTVVFQRRGFGLSEQISYVPTIEQQADDVIAVMTDAGMSRAVLAGPLSAAAALALVAARTPDRVVGSVYYEPLAVGPEVAEHIDGWTDEELGRYRVLARHAYDTWGSGNVADVWEPVLASDYNRRLMAMLERSSATPGAAMAYYDWLCQLDIRDLLKSVQVPVRVIHAPSNVMPTDAVRVVADLLPLGTFHLLPPSQPGTTLGQAYIQIVDHVLEVATGRTQTAASDRFLGTVLFTDVVSSTELLATMGDAKYGELRSTHERLVKLAIEASDGRLVKVIGDGTLSVFDSPSAAVRCAEQIRGDAADLDLQVRCGVHTGEVEREGMDIGGMTVHIAARVEAAARPGEVVVSRTVRDLVVGSGLTFAGRGEHRLKGVPGTWELFAVADDGEQANSVPVDASIQTRADKLTVGAARHAPQLVRTFARMANAVERRRAKTQR